MDITALMLITTGVLVFFLIVLMIIWVLIPPRREEHELYMHDEDELGQIKHQVEMEGEREAEEELMPYKPPRLDSPRNRKRF